MDSLIAEVTKALPRDGFRFVDVSEIPSYESPFGTPKSCLLIRLGDKVAIHHDGSQQYESVKANPDGQWQLYISPGGILMMMPAVPVHVG